MAELRALLLVALVCLAPAAWGDGEDGIAASGTDPGHWNVPAIGPGLPGPSSSEEPGGFSKVQIEFKAPPGTSDGGVYIKQSTGGRPIYIDGWRPGELQYKPTVENGRSVYRMYLGYQDKIFGSSNDEVTVQIIASRTEKVLATLHLHPYSEGNKGRNPIVVRGRTMGYYIARHSTQGSDGSKVDSEQPAAKLVPSDEMSGAPSEVWGRDGGGKEKGAN